MVVVKEKKRKEVYFFFRLERRSMICYIFIDLIGFDSIGVINKGFVVSRMYVWV